jgi:hypothetical protein
MVKQNDEKMMRKPSDFGAPQTEGARKISQHIQIVPFCSFLSKYIAKYHLGR